MGPQSPRLKPQQLFLWGNANRLPVPTPLTPTLITLCPNVHLKAATNMGSR